MNLENCSPKISIFASAIIEDKWEAFTESLRNNDVSYEIVFAGHVEPTKDYHNLRHIKTGRINPAQCYQIAAHYSNGELLGLCADDATYPDGFLDGIWEMYQKDKHVCICCDINERGGLCLSESYTVGDRDDTPRCASFGFFTKELFKKVGGYDKRYICGQYENNFSMQLHALGVKFVDYKDKHISIEHIASSDFSKYHDIGRRITMENWAKHYNGESQRDCNWSLVHNNEHQPYIMDDTIYTVNQGGIGEW